MRKYLKRGALVLVSISVLSFLALNIKINSVSCKSQFGVCSDEINQLFTQAEGENIISSRNKIEELASTHNKIVSFSISFALPPSYEVHIEEKKPQIALKNINKSSYFLIDFDGDTVRESDSTVLPIVFVENDVDNTDTLSFTANLVSSLNQYYQLESSKLESDKLTVKFKSGRIIIFPLSGDIDILLGSVEVLLFRLNSISQNSKIEGSVNSAYNTIDLRFNNPVIK